MQADQAVAAAAPEPLGDEAAPVSVTQLYTLSNEVVDRLALKLNESLEMRYMVANHEHHLAFDRFNPDPPAATQQRPGALAATPAHAAVGATSSTPSTSAELPVSARQHVTIPTETVARDTSGIDRELQRRRAERQSACLQNQAPLKCWGSAPRSTDAPFLELQRLQSVELEDLWDVEKAMFHAIVKARAESPRAALAELQREEAQARKAATQTMLDDSCNLLATLRTFIEAVEENRCLSHYRARHTMRTADSDTETTEAPCPLDIRFLVPLQLQSSTIRREVETEEDLSFKKMILAERIEADLLRLGLVVWNPARQDFVLTAKAAGPWVRGEVPDHRSALEHFLWSQRWFAALREETQRMALISQHGSSLNAIIEEFPLLFPPVRSPRSVKRAEAELREQLQRQRFPQIWRSK